jgi:antirestriction protein ArdC
MSTTVPSTKFDVYRAITDKIVQAIEAGAGAFVMPWHSQGAPIGRPTNAATGMSYRGVNVVALWAESVMSGFGSGTWASFRQWQKLGAQVRKGEHGATIVFYKKLDVDETNEDEGKGRRMVARASHVFNSAQVDGWATPTPEVSDPARVLDEVAAFVASIGANIRYVRGGACYRRSEDLIEMPYPGLFMGSPTSTPTESYYSTLLHELTHWTGASHRLDREFGKRFGDQAYAFEELIAELGAAFLCADLDVTNDPRPDHAAYVGLWLKVLGTNPKALFTAARQATLAAEYLHKPVHSATKVAG